MSEEAVRTYLEMREPALTPVALPDGVDAQIARMSECPASFWRYLYSEVGRAYRWTDRLPWSDDRIRQYLADPAVSLFLMTLSGAPAGYFELRADQDGGVEIAYLGLLPEFTGRGLGRFLLSEAVRHAWALAPSRVWLHTCTLDHPAALQNYLKRGFTIFRTETYEPGV